ncbi:MAG: hypothetical protein Q4E91_06075 [Lachnospiraceae bacterium]|nr:hypothetical protein [Lachnospiraceae bacterium]
MSRVINTMELIEKSINNINERYDMSIGNINDIYNASDNPFDMICNGFRFGYMQGMKAAKAQQKARKTS